MRAAHALLWTPGWVEPDLVYHYTTITTYGKWSARVVCEMMLGRALREMSPGFKLGSGRATETEAAGRKRFGGTTSTAEWS